MKNRDEFFAVNERFHMRLLEIAGNRWRNQMVADLRKVMKLNRHNSLLKSGRIEESLAEHRAVMEALVARDAAGRARAHAASTSTMGWKPRPEDAERRGHGLRTELRRRTLRWPMYNQQCFRSITRNLCRWQQRRSWRMQGWASTASDGPIVDAGCGGCVSDFPLRLQSVDLRSAFEMRGSRAQAAATI